MGGFIMTIPIRLILYISYIITIVSPLIPLPTALKGIALKAIATALRSFFILFHVGI
jgi:Flp pilus assembly protein protease CpaA